MLSRSERDELKALVDRTVRRTCEHGRGAWINESGKDGEAAPGNWMPVCRLPERTRFLAYDHAE